MFPRVRISQQLTSQSSTRSTDPRFHGSYGGFRERRNLVIVVTQHFAQQERYTLILGQSSERPIETTS
jgi:hypothetical protein